MQWVTHFKDGPEHVNDKPHFGWPSVIMDKLVTDAVDEKLRDDRIFTNTLKINGIATYKLNFKFCAS